MNNEILQETFREDPALSKLFTSVANQFATETLKAAYNFF